MNSRTAQKAASITYTAGYMNNLNADQLTAMGIFLLAIVTTLVGAVPIGLVFMVIGIYYLGKGKK